MKRLKDWLFVSALVSVFGAFAASGASAQQCTAIETILVPEFIIAGLGTCLGPDPERDVLLFQPIPQPECEPCSVEVTGAWSTGSESLIRTSPWPSRT